MTRPNYSSREIGTITGPRSSASPKRTARCGQPCRFGANRNSACIAARSTNVGIVHSGCYVCIVLTEACKCSDVSSGNPVGTQSSDAASLQEARETEPTERPAKAYASVVEHHGRPEL